jgi:hypothetical protein
MAVECALFPKTGSILSSDDRLEPAIGWLDEDGDECPSDRARYAVVLEDDRSCVVDLDSLARISLN